MAKCDGMCVQRWIIIDVFDASYQVHGVKSFVIQ